MPLILLACALAALPGQTGSPSRGALAGTVRDSASGEAVSGALINVASDDGSVRYAVTGDDGRFQLDALAPGRYRVKASKPGYLWSAYAASQSRQAGPSIQIGGGQLLDGIDISLTRTAAVSGTVRDEYGRGVPGVAVLGVPNRSLGVTGADADLRAMTDARGEYRLGGLIPGEYFVVAQPPENVQQQAAGRAEADNDALLQQLRQGVRDRFAGVSANLSTPAPTSYGPTYFPGTPDPAAAAAVAIDAGAVRKGLDIMLQPVRVARVHGAISVPNGYDAAFVEVALVPRHAALGHLAKSTTVFPRKGFEFTLESVAPGPYVLVVQGPQQSLGPDGSPWPLWSIEEVNVPAAEVFALDVRLQPSGRVTGEIRPSREGGDVDVGGWTVRLSSRETSIPARMAGQMSAVSDNNGQFSIAGIAPTLYDLAVTHARTQAEGWRPEAASAGGRDVLDAPVRVRPDGPTELAVTVTARDARLIGRVEGGEAVVMTDFHLIVFPRDESLRASSRRVADVPLRADGQYDVRGLPDGDYLISLLVGRVGDLRASRALIDVLSTGAVPVTLTAGETTRQDIRIAR